MDAIRLLQDPPLHGAANMARDEALLNAGATGEFAATLRLYRWVPATISLGYFQDYREFEKLPEPAGRLPVVRRTTGGGAILHDLELTYSLTMPIDHSLIRGRPNTLYEVAHEAVIDTIGHGTHMLGCDHEACDASPRSGPFFCFARRHGLDVVVEDPPGATGICKIAGSAQRRTRQAILQHGSIMLDSRFTQQSVATWKQVAGGVTFEQAAEQLAVALAEKLDMSLSRSEWRTAELQQAAEIEVHYSGEGWTRHRQR